MRDPDRISILMYHQVGRFRRMRTHRTNYVDQACFARQMGLIARLGYRVIDLDTAVECLSGRLATPERALVLTFDDAYDNFADAALPVLQRHGFPATVYAISGWLGRHAEWLSRAPGSEPPTLMSCARLREIQAAGMTVGSHTVSHVRLAEATPAEQERELGDSKAALEDCLGAEVHHLCYPFGSFDRHTVRSAEDAGYRSASTHLRGVACTLDHPLALPRKAISFGDNLFGFWWKLRLENAPKPALTEWRRRLADDPIAFEKVRL